MIFKMGPTVINVRTLTIMEFIVNTNWVDNDLEKKMMGSPDISLLFIFLLCFAGANDLNCWHRASAHSTRAPESNNILFYYRDENSQLLKSASSKWIILLVFLCVDWNLPSFGEVYNFLHNSWTPPSSWIRAMPSRPRCSMSSRSVLRDKPYCAGRPSIVAICYVWVFVCK